jgi:hypothetical protein
MSLGERIKKVLDQTSLLEKKSDQFNLEIKRSKVCHDGMHQIVLKVMHHMPNFMSLGENIKKKFWQRQVCKRRTRRIQGKTICLPSLKGRNNYIFLLKGIFSEIKDCRWIFSWGTFW